MIDAIKRIIKKHNGLKLLVVFLKAIVDKELLSNIVDSTLDYKSEFINHFGDKNKDKVIYVIRIDSTSGFAVVLKNILKYLSYADYYNFFPVITISDKFRYSYNNYPYNAYDMYFKQPSIINLNEIAASANVIFSKRYDLNFFSERIGYSIKDSDITEFARVYAKYIQINDEINDIICADISKLLGEMIILGVHVRGTDFKRNYKNHPVYVPVDVYLNEVLEELKRSHYEAVFLATDDEEVIDVFNSNISVPVLSFNCTRSKEMTSIHYKKGVDPFKIGKEVLRDIIALSKCTSFIGGLSNVSTMARVFNESSGKKFKSCRIIDYGINTKGKVLK